MPKRISLQQIADKVGVSKMTVSLALREHPRIPRATQERVKKVAGELGYKPNPEVAQLMSAIRKDTSDDQGLPLAYVTTGENRSFWRNSPTELAYWDGASARAKTYGYYLEEHWMDEPRMTERRLSDILWNRGVKGIIVPPMVRTLTGKIRHVKLAFNWQKFAAVTIGDMLTSPELNRVIHDHYASILTAMDKLIELGYRRIGLCLTEHMDLTVNQRWQAGYRVYRANHPIERIEPLIVRDLSASAIQEWIDNNQLDAIIGAELRMPRFFQEMGLQMGKDLAYADLDLDIDNPSHRHISGIVQNSGMLGMAAVDLVVSSLNRNQLGAPEVPFVMQVEGTWKLGPSTPKRKKPNTRRKPASRSKK
ncbi:LacI family transcriptional regulator [Puniceicoccales bacterium CK1056]|uniref:LacI family transcriptional regulator n=1 Tax=Oceanipulchritudo coccoides TaxID=2706888 RepID=A0A6B2M3B4_9BACT|nr:LacI family DNA-binding transcriptional regulator [Oceanipulchritudo coccoides]NDV62802.1 LacI family transcriptional regulator [Oceanipulchritudo coccoides]